MTHTTFALDRSPRTRAAASGYVLCLLTLSACMTQPLSGQPLLPSRDTAVKFRTWSQQPADAPVVQCKISESEWATIGALEPDGTVVTHPASGVNVYAASGDIRVPDSCWSPDTVFGVADTAVVRTLGGGSSYYTFDGAGYQCLLQQFYAAGSTLRDSVLGCTNDDFFVILLAKRT